MLSWYEIYRNRMCESYVEHVRNKYDEFVNLISNSERANMFVEIGCGAGNITKIIRETNKSKDAKYVLIDNCEKMLGLAEVNNKEDNRCSFVLESIVESKPYADLKDISTPKSTIVHSHGLLEHFSDNDISTIITNSMDLSNEQVHYVPGIKYDVPSRGDERLMTQEQWSSILERSLSNKLKYNFNIYSFNDEYDLILHVTKTESI
jgi:SAM-dependent methyltransferase